MERELIIRMAQQAGIAHAAGIYMEHLERFYELAFAAGAAHEREACAVLCEEIDDASYPHTRKWPSDCAAAIRARGGNGF